MDEDVVALMQTLDAPVNLEMAATDEMIAIALRENPHAVCLVPERREERTTEGGLNVLGDDNRLAHVIGALTEGGPRVSLFIEPDPAQIRAAARLGAPVVELHTGPYHHAHVAGDMEKAAAELEALRSGAKLGASLGLEVHAGHGLNFENVGDVAAIPELMELNIGHFLIGEAIFSGLDSAIKRMRALMDQARAEATGSMSA